MFFLIFFEYANLECENYRYTRAVHSNLSGAELCKLYIKRFSNLKANFLFFAVFWLSYDFLRGFCLTHFACWNNKTHKFSACCPCCAALFFSLSIHDFLFFNFSYFHFLLFFAFSSVFVFLSNVIFLYANFYFIFVFAFCVRARVSVFVFGIIFIVVRKVKEGEEGGGKRQLSRKYAAYNTRTLKTH